MEIIAGGIRETMKDGRQQCGELRVSMEETGGNLPRAFA